jgi:hypothetical protein
MSIIDYFDDRILNILYSITQFGVALACLIVYSVFKKKYLNKISLGYLTNAIGISLITLRDIVPGFLSVWIANTLLVLGLYILYDGMAFMLHHNRRTKLITYLASAFAIIHFIFTFIQPNLGMRIINFSFFSTLGALYITLVGIRYLRYQFNTIVMTITITHFLHIIMNSLRIIDTLGQSEMTQLFSGISIFKYYILYSIFLSITRLTCIILYNTKDLVQLD